MDPGMIETGGLLGLLGALLWYLFTKLLPRIMDQHIAGLRENSGAIKQVAAATRASTAENHEAHAKIVTSLDSVAARLESHHDSETARGERLCAVLERLVHEKGSE